MGGKSLKALMNQYLYKPEKVRRTQVYVAGLEDTDTFRIAVRQSKGQSVSYAVKMQGYKRQRKAATKTLIAFIDAMYEEGLIEDDVLQDQESLR